MSKNQKNKKRIISRPEREIILEYISIPKRQMGSQKQKRELADELGLTLPAIRYKVNKFLRGEGLGRKQRNDKGIPKKDTSSKIKREFFAELARGTSIDDATKKLGLKENMGNKLAKEYAKTDKWKAIRNAPQLDHLRTLITQIFDFDLALVDTELHGSFRVDVKKGDDEFVIMIPFEELNDIKSIIAHCMQRNDMAKIDPAYADIKKDDLERARVYYLKEDLLEKRNVTEYVRLHKAVKPLQPIGQLDLKLVYAIINRFNPGLDETSKINIIREEYEKIKVGSK